MYSQYIPHFPTLWLTKDERSLLYKYFILNPSLRRISSIVSSHLQVLYIVQKSADLGKGHVLVSSPAAPGAAALLPGRACERGSLLFGTELGWPRDLVISEGWMWPRCPPAPGGPNSGSGSKKHACGFASRRRLCPCFQPLTWARRRE